MLEDIQWPRSVNLTVSLGKAFEITYVRLKFFSSRPESFAIYKRQNEDSAWVPFQFYSASCEETYNLSAQAVLTSENEGEAVCRDDFSDISPLTGGSVAFSTLEGRPKAYEFEKSKLLQDWVTATDIRIVLNRINTFRDEVFGDPNVLRSYFYAISDFAIGGRCKCHGHASECVRSEERGGRLTCKCQHYTDGPDCERCLPFYNDIPWKRAIAGQITECKACNCNGRSEICRFDEGLYELTGHGGYCLNCNGNTDGPNCERCKDTYYRLRETEDCLHCHCHPLGSLSLQCDVYGRCNCKPGVTGDKCDQCQPVHYNLTEVGCSTCDCLVAGSLHNQPYCDSISGDCLCKEHVEGQKCDRCKDGYFNLEEEDVLGCMSCFCFGHSSKCILSTVYSPSNIRSQFSEGTERWKAVTRSEAEVELGYSVITKEVRVASEEEADFAYFVFPRAFLGDQRFSYNQPLSFKLRIENDGPRPSIVDIIIEGNGIQVSAPIYSQRNQMPSHAEQLFKFILSEHANYQWTPRLTSLDFNRMLSNLTSIKIRGTYTTQGVGYLSDVSLRSAVHRSSGDDPIGAVEQCTCPEGYVGQFCESCAPGYRRDPPYAGPHATCIPCNCNNHSDDCDLNTGRCICDHNTTGENCEQCIDGFYGFATKGTPEDCQPCPCPDDARCVELLNGDVSCFDCPLGSTGHRCEFCADGYYGDPLGRFGEPRPCTLCSCNSNIDLNAVGNCNSTTGECLRCIYNTAGYYCEKCLSGYYGNALGLPHGDCQACECFPLGSSHNGEYHDTDEQIVISCDNITGLCPCLSNVIGQRCDQCQDGYWNIFSGSGCETCNCDRMGSVNRSCDVSSGQCYCKDGVSGVKCDQCVPNYYGFSPEGCTRCNCDPDGSLSLQCETTSGQCPCRPHVVGRHCDRCTINRHNLTAGCIDCPACYETVKNASDEVNAKLRELRNIIFAIRDTPPEALNDTDYLERLAEVNRTVHQLWIDAKGTSEAVVYDSYKALHDAIEDVMTMSGSASIEIAETRRHIHNAKIDASEAELALNETDMKLKAAEKYLNTDGMRALNESFESQKKLGQQSESMTNMAKEARLITERLEAEAHLLTEKAESALNASQEALTLIQEVFLKPGTVAKGLKQLETEVQDTIRLYNDTKVLAETGHSTAGEVYSEAVSIYTDVNSLQIVDIDMESLKMKTDAIHQTAIDLTNDADGALNDQRQLGETIVDLKRNASESLAEGRIQQEILENLKGDAETARDIAKDAVDRADDILQKANEILNTLKQFDNRVQQSRLEAEMALTKIPDIEELIEDAKNVTKYAIEGLEDAEKEAVMAQNLAELAYNVSVHISQELVDLKEETSLTRSRSEQLEIEVNELVANITDLEEKLTQMEIQADSDRQDIEGALVQADKAKIGAQKSSETVSTALSEVEHMLATLDEQPSVDIRVLDFLERYLDSAEKRLMDARLDDQFQNLVDLKSVMEVWISTYDGEIRQLTDDIDNIRLINQTLPRDCFKKVDLEPKDVSG